MPEHECTFPESEYGIVLDDATCTVCGATVMSGYLLDVDIDPAS